MRPLLLRVLRQSLRRVGQLLRLDYAVARRAVDEAGVAEERAVEAEQGRHAADPELLERTQHPAPGVLPVDPVDDQLRDHRVVERRDLGTVLDAGVHTDARAPRAPGSP